MLCASALNPRGPSCPLWLHPSTLRRSSCRSTTTSNHLFNTLPLLLWKIFNLFLQEEEPQTNENTENYTPKKSKFKHPLIVLEEAKKSKEFVALDHKLSAFLNKTQIKLGSFVIQSNKLNLRAHQERYITSFIAFLTKATRLHIGEYNAKIYSKYQVILDLLTEFQDDVLGPVKSPHDIFSSC